MYKKINMINKKLIKVLVLPSDKSGVGAFRSVNPHIGLEELYPDEFHVDINYEPNFEDEEWLKQYDIVHYHRSLGRFEDNNKNLKKLLDLGITPIMDIDDYWSPGSHHPAHLIIKNSGMDEKIVSNLKSAKYVTTTTPIFAKEIEKYNKNVFVLPNAINPNDKQYTPNPEKSDKIRIGWLGGSSHKKDLELLTGIVGRLKNDNLLDKVQFVLCGFDLRGTITMIDQKTGQQTQRPIKPHESVWYNYEQIFTDNYKSVSDEYKKHLLSFTKDEFEGVEKEPYRRVWTKPVTTYATNYNLFDISLAPLVENKFNEMKSQLKVIEAGFHKKALIAQDFASYKIDLKNAYVKPKDKKSQPEFDTTANAYMVDSSKNDKQWYQFIKRLIRNPEEIKILGDNLYNTVKDTYSIEAVSKERRELYLKLVGNN